jgi:hypothetical protein
MIFRICKCQNRNFSQIKIPNLEGLFSCYDFWICCESSNGKNYKPNFVSFGVKLKEL